MKRIFILVVVALLAMGSVFAEESVLIDFSKLTADIMPDQNDVPQENRATLMDFTNEATSNFTARQKVAMKSSLAITNWDVVFSSSSRNINTKHLSYTKEAPSKEWEKVMGVRIHFPVEAFNSWAIVKPPFDIPAFEPPSTVDDDGNIEPNEGESGVTGPSRFEGEADEEGKPSGGLGVVKNVGTLKSVAVNAYGLNFPHSLSVILVDDKGKEKIVFMGYLNFEGWGELRWDNPAYVQNVRNRELRLYPIYPESTPFVKFGGFLIQRSASSPGGDFIGYFKDVKLIYDKAVLDTERDIEDESLWNIIQDRETARKTSELQRLGQKEVQRLLDIQRQATETTFTPTAGAGGEGGDDEGGGEEE
ncbi:MAG: flagellar filament outer layer protein FlaA [Treponema sp.]|jgi:hypothetical protein|nr:flagellar filament outer layer protein FlaA [Treponema sp.]